MEEYLWGTNSSFVGTTSSLATQWSWSLLISLSRNVRRINWIFFNIYISFSPDSPQEFSLLHWFSFSLFLSGVSALLLGHGHYSIDVLLGYWVTTRTWAMYHTLANNTILKIRNNHNTLQTLWWWRVFIFLEGNVPGPLPHVYGVPVPGLLRRKAGRIWRLVKRERESVWGCEYVIWSLMWYVFIHCWIIRSANI